MFKTRQHYFTHTSSIIITLIKQTVSSINTIPLKLFLLQC